MIALLQAAHSFMPDTLNEWLQLVLTYAVGAGLLIGSIWRWGTKPLRDAITAETAARVKAMDDEKKDHDREHEQEKKDYDRNHAEIKEKMVLAVDTAHVAAGKTELLERNLQLYAADCSGLHEDVGRLDGEVRSMAQAQQTAELARLRELGEIRNQLTRLETIILEGRKERP